MNKTTPLINNFFNTSTPSLKICGITQPAQAMKLAELKVPALGINFWPKSKRYCPHLDAQKFLTQLQGEILRIGVFVNASHQEIIEIYQNGLLDIVQLHGDEPPAYAQHLNALNIPLIRATSLTDKTQFTPLAQYPSQALLLDAHAPKGLYGGTGKTADWQLIKEFHTQHPNRPLLLAGGITPDNINQALDTIQPSVIDIASGAEISPGKKDFTKIKKLLTALKTYQTKK